MESVLNNDSLSSQEFMIARELWYDITITYHTVYYWLIKNVHKKQFLTES